MDERKLLPEIVKRRALRGFSGKSVDAAVVERILEAARRAPSCANKQPVRFLVLTGEEALEKGREALAGGNYWARHAPVLIYAITREDLDCRLSEGRDYAKFDTGLAVENLLLQAVHEGLVGHPMAGFDPLKIRELFGIPDAFTVLTAVAIGHPGEGSYLNDKHRSLESAPQERKPFAETVFMNEWPSM